MAAHRYWRLQLTSGPSAAYAFSEIQFRAIRGTPLLFASAAPATAGQTFGSVPGTFDATMAADNSTLTLWSSTNKVPPQWWAYDYGATSTDWLDVVEVTIQARNDGNFAQAPGAFDLQYSDDNSAWTTVQSFTAPTMTSAGQIQTFTTPNPQPQLPWHSTLTDQKRVLDQAMLDDDDAFTMASQQRLTRHPASWGGLVVGGVYVNGVEASKFIQYVVLGPPPGLLASKFVQHIVLTSYQQLPTPPAMLGYQLRSIPGIDIGNDETPNLNLIRSRFVSADILHAPLPPAPVASRLVGYQLLSMPGIDVGNDETPNLSLLRRRFASPNTWGMLAPPAQSRLIGYQSRSIPGIDIGNDETPNLNQIRRQFASPNTWRVIATPAPSRLIGYQLRSIPGIDIGTDETPNLNLSRRRFVSPDTYSGLALSLQAFVVVM